MWLYYFDENHINSSDEVFKGVEVTYFLLWYTLISIFIITVTKCIHAK